MLGLCLALDLGALAGDVAGIGRLDVDGECHLRRQARIKRRPVRCADRGTGGERLVADLGPAQQVERVRIVRQWRVEQTRKRGPRGLAADEVQRTQAGKFRIDGVRLGGDEPGTLGVDQAERHGSGRQAQVGVVLAQAQAVLGTAREHAVWLRRTAGDQVVDHDADIGLGPGRAPRRLVSGGARGVQSGNESLRRGFLVAGRAVDLACQIERLEVFGFERGLQRPRIVVVVFDRVARPRHVRPLQAAYRMHDTQLHVEWQRGRDAVRIDLVGIEALRLQEDLVRGASGEAADLVLDRRAVARPGALDLAVVERRAVARRVYQRVRCLVRGGDMARYLARMIGGHTEE